MLVGIPLPHIWANPISKVSNAVLYTQLEAPSFYVLLVIGIYMVSFLLAFVEFSVAGASTRLSLRYNTMYMYNILTPRDDL